MASRFQKGDPRARAMELREMLTEAADQLADDLVDVTDAQARALFETSREVLAGLIRAFEHYEENAPAWRDSRLET